MFYSNPISPILQYVNNNAGHVNTQSYIKQNIPKQMISSTVYKTIHLESISSIWNYGL